MTTELIRKQYENLGKEKLQKARKNLKAIVMDQDGTVKGGEDPLYQKANVAELLKKIARAGKHPAIITASGASALKSVASLVDFYAEEKIPTSTYIGIGNGTALYRFEPSGRTEIYNHGLTIDEEKSIIKVWQEVYKTLGIKESELQPKGIETFRKFMETDWTGYIPPEYIELFRQYGGQCFTEPIKVTVALPVWEAEKQRELVKQLQLSLNSGLGRNKFIALRGDDIYLHITHSFDIDPKLFALQTIMRELGIQGKNIVAFGDLPLDNDRGLLVESKLPFTFTNHEFGKQNANRPPYILPESSVSSVGSVYKAIDYLLS